MNGRRQCEHRERDSRESLGASSERQSAKRQEAAWHRSAENNTEIKTLGIDRERERGLVDLSAAWALTPWLASSHAPSPLPAPLGFPGSSLFLERAKRLPDAGPCTCCSQPARRSPPLASSAPHAATSLVNSYSPFASQFTCLSREPSPAPGGEPVPPQLALIQGCCIICRAKCNMKVQGALFKNYHEFWGREQQSV